MSNPRKITLIVSAFWMGWSVITPAMAQKVTMSSGQQHALAACLVSCRDGDRACSNQCISKFQTRGWSDDLRACFAGCRLAVQAVNTINPPTNVVHEAIQTVTGCISGCLVGAGANEYFSPKK
jgi:hypothetical protein